MAWDVLFSPPLLVDLDAQPCPHESLPLTFKGKGGTKLCPQPPGLGPPKLGALHHRWGFPVPA